MSTDDDVKEIVVLFFQLIDQIISSSSLDTDEIKNSMKKFEELLSKEAEFLSDKKCFQDRKELVNLLISQQLLTKSFSNQVIDPKVKVSEDCWKAQVKTLIWQEEILNNQDVITRRFRRYKFCLAKCCYQWQIVYIKAKTISEKSEKLGGCDRNVKIITQASIPLRIDSPGRYCLVENVQWGETSQPAIQINASNVELDLNQYQIDLQGKGFQGIQVRNCQNVTIQNGSVVNSSFNFTEQDQIAVPLFQSLSSVPNVRIAAVRLLETRDIFLNNLYIDNVLYGILGTQVISGVYVKNSTVTRFGIRGELNGIIQPIGAGIMVTGTDNLNRATDFTAENCSAVSESAKDGFNVVFVDRFQWLNCQGGATEASQLAPPSLGSFSVQDSSYGVLNNCIARFSEISFFSLRAISVDIDNFVAQECQADGIQTVFSRLFNIRNCTAFRRISGQLPPAKDGSGIKLIASDFITVKNCVVTDFNRPSTPPGSGRNGIGISLSGCKNCTIDNNITSTNSIGIRDQINVQLGQFFITGGNNRFYNNISHDNLLQNYANISNVVASDTISTLTAVVPYVNVQAPNLPVGPL